jgi:hypothetical protein
MPIRNRIINHPDDLSGLSVWPLKQPSPRGHVRIAGKSDKRKRSKWEKDLNRAYRACGCGMASLGTVMGLAAAGAWYFAGMYGKGDFGWTEGLNLFVVVVVGTAIGKLLGLLQAEHSLKRTIAQVKKEWKAPPQKRGADHC